MRSVLNSIILLLGIIFLVFGERTEKVLQEGKDGYTGCEDASIVDPKAETQLGTFKGGDKDRVTSSVYTC